MLLYRLKAKDELRAHGANMLASKYRLKLLN
jgi:hypothetical protein